jgi:hypothetical protein
LAERVETDLDPYLLEYKEAFSKKPNFDIPADIPEGIGSQSPSSALRSLPENLSRY